MSEEQFAELGAIEARHEPPSIFALQHMARIEAQKAYVHLECSRRVQRALTKNASAFPREFSIGDLVTFRRDNQEEVHLGHLPRECLAMKGRRTCGCCVAMFLCWLLHRMWGLQVHLKLWPSQFSMEIQFYQTLSMMVDNNLSWMQEELQLQARTVLCRLLLFWMMRCLFGIPPVPEEGRWLCLEYSTRYLWWWWQRWWWWWRWRTSSRCSSEQKKDSHSCCFWQKRQTKNGSATPGVRERDIVDAFTQSFFSVWRSKCISIGKCTCVERECAAFLAQHSSKSSWSTSTTSWSLYSCTSSTGRRSRRSKNYVYNFPLSTGKRSRWSTRQEGVESHSLWFCSAWCARRLARFACQGVTSLFSSQQSRLPKTISWRRDTSWCPASGHTRTKLNTRKGRLTMLQFGRAELCHAETLKPQRGCAAIRLRRTLTFICW